MIIKVNNADNFLKMFEGSAFNNMELEKTMVNQYIFGKTVLTIARTLLPSKHINFPI